MNEILSILIAMLCIYGFYAALCEVRKLLIHLARRPREKIDKGDKKEYNNTHTE